MIALRGKVRRVDPSSPRSSPTPESIPPVVIGDESKMEASDIPPPGSFTWCGLWAFGTVPGPIDGEDDMAMVPPHKRPRPILAGTPRGFVYKFQEVIEAASVPVPSVVITENGEGDKAKKGEKETKRSSLAETKVQSAATERVITTSDTNGDKAKERAAQDKSKPVALSEVGSKDNGEDSELAKEGVSKDAGKDEGAEKYKIDTPETEPNKGKGTNAVTFATPGAGNIPYTDASHKYPGKCPPGGRWTGYFENTTKRKDRLTARISEQFDLFFNATPPEGATVLFTDVSFEGEDDSREEISNNNGDSNKDALLPDGHVHVRGSGFNQYGTFEIIGGYDPDAEILRCQRMYVATTEKASNAKAKSPRRARSASEGAPRGRPRGSAKSSKLSPLSNTTVTAERRSARKRQISWRKAFAYEQDSDSNDGKKGGSSGAGSGNTKKRPRAMSEAAGKTAAAAKTAAQGKGLSISAANAAEAAKAALLRGNIAGILSPRGALSGVSAGSPKSQIQRKANTSVKASKFGGGASLKKVAKAVSAPAPVASIKLPPTGDPKKAKWRAAHYFLYQKHSGDGVDTPSKGSQNSGSGRPSSPSSTLGGVGGTQRAQFVVYEGEMNNGMREGQGACLYNNGLMYEGSWKRNKEHGKGMLLTADRSRIIYDGDWERGRMHGQGVYYYPKDGPFRDLLTDEGADIGGKNDRDTSGGVYSGDFKENARYGMGTYTLPDGSMYEGDWRDNLPSGRGTFRWPNGSHYSGQWKDGERNGHGVLNASDGFSYEGSWVSNSMEGRGVAIYPKGQKYEGAWVGGKREGRGTIVFTNGAVYEGRFRDDLMEGQGTLKMTRNATVSSASENKHKESSDRDPKDNVSSGVKEDWMIPIQFQSDMGHIHQKAGFTEGGE